MVNWGGFFERAEHGSFWGDDGDLGWGGLDKTHEMGTRGGCCAGEDETYSVGEDFEDDDPPGVVGFDSGFLRLSGVGKDVGDLLLGEFDFHVTKVLDDWDCWVLMGLLGFDGFDFEICCKDTNVVQYTKTELVI